MRYRALFIGGPIDGQERVLNDNRPVIEVIDPSFICHISNNTVPINTAAKVVIYNRLYHYGMTLIYSVSGMEETLEIVWQRYCAIRFMQDLL